MFFYKNLYVGPSIQDPAGVKRKLMRGEGQFTIYVIALSPSKPGPGANQLEILHCVNLQQPYYKAYPPYIIGIASGRIEAMEMVESMVQEAYDHTGSGDVRAYLFPHGVRRWQPVPAAQPSSAKEPDDAAQPISAKQPGADAADPAGTT